MEIGLLQLVPFSLTFGKAIAREAISAFTHDVFMYHKNVLASCQRIGLDRDANGLLDRVLEIDAEESQLRKLLTDDEQPT